MARRPFFGQNDTKIAKMDMQAATAPGRAYAAAFQKLGDIASDTLEKFREKKEEKEREDNFERMAKKLPSEVFSAFDIQSEEEKSDFIKSIKKKGPREDAMAIMSFYQKAQDAQDARDVRNLQLQQIQQSMEGQQADRLRADKEREKTTNFLNFMAQPGPAQIDPSGPDRNSVLRNIRAGKGATPPARMVPGPSPAEQSVMSPQAKEIIRNAILQKQPMDKVLPMAKQIDQEIAQSQPKPMTPEELADYEGTLLKNEGLRIKNLQDKDKLDKTLNPPIGDESYTDAVLGAIDGIYDIMDNGPKTKGPVSGLGAETFMNIGGSNAANAAALIKTIMSDVAFSRLQKMRNESPTGGALGQVSNIELDLLKSARGSLDQKISPPLFRKNLDLIKKHYDNFMRSIQARKLANQQGLTFETTEEAISWMDKNVPMGGKPAPDNQTNIITKGGFVLTAPGN